MRPDQKPKHIEQENNSFIRLTLNKILLSQDSIEPYFNILARPILASIAKRSAMLKP